VSASGRRIGLLGGTFNPPHLAHLALARAALEQCHLERVLLVPARVAPHKPEGDDPGAEHRLAMCRLLCRGEEDIETSALELDRPAPSYTVDTLHFIHTTNPDVELTLILGADMALTLPRWREPHEILRLCGLAVAERDEARRGAVERAARGIDPHARVELLELAPCELSSSMVRSRLAAGEPAQGLVGRAVAGYIAEHGLYR
jgi:nicotinate-nucleotide adenylyltransferase